MSLLGIVAGIEKRWVDQFTKVAKGYGELTSYALDPSAAARLIGKQQSPPWANICPGQ